MLCCAASKFGLTLCVGVVAGFVVHSSMSPSAAMQPEGEDVSPEQMMEMMKEMSKPVAEHEVLKAMVGTWDCRAKFYMEGPESPPSVSTGVSEMKLILGGRYIIQDIEMDDFLGDSFEGMGFVGYDRATGEYVNDWIDSWSTGIMRMTGTYDESNGTFDWRGTWNMATPDGAVVVPSHHVIKHVNDDMFIMEFWEMGQDGNEFQNGEIQYTRRK